MKKSHRRDDDEDDDGDERPVPRRRAAPQQDYSGLIRLLILLSIAGSAVGLVVFAIFLAAFGMMASKVQDHHNEVLGAQAKGFTRELRTKDAKHADE